MAASDITVTLEYPKEHLELLNSLRGAYTSSPNFHFADWDTAIVWVESSVTGGIDRNQRFQTAPLSTVYSMVPQLKPVQHSTRPLSNVYRRYQAYDIDSTVDHWLVKYATRIKIFALASSGKP